MTCYVVLNLKMLTTMRTNIVFSPNLFCYKLDDRGSRVPFPAGAASFSLHHRVQTGSEAHPASY